MVFSFNQKDYRLSRDIPAELTRYLIPGSDASALANEYLKLLVQELPAESSKAFYSVYLVDKKSNFRLKDDAPFLRAYLALQHDLHLDIAGLGKIVIKEGQFNIFYTPSTDLVSQHDNVPEYLTLYIQYDMALLEEWEPYFPVLADFLQSVRAGQPATLLPRPEWATKEIQDLAHRMLHISLEDPAQRKHFTLLVNTLLFHLLYQAVQQQPASNYNYYEVDSIHAARDMIRKNIRYHFIIKDP
ncbi:MAG TPA: hypothetical protein VHC48_20280 [Puia sp.]|nr:hypothetical protein [Puia sp.]